MTWIRTISPQAASGRLARSYASAIRRAGRVFQIVRIMSLSPATLDASMGIYGAVMYGRSELSRRQREMLAVVVSVINHCHY